MPTRWPPRSTTKLIFVFFEPGHGSNNKYLICLQKAHIVLSCLQEDCSVPRYPRLTEAWICSSCLDEVWQYPSCLQKVTTTSMRTDPWFLFQSQQREAVDHRPEMSNDKGKGTRIKASTRHCACLFARDNEKRQNEPELRVHRTAYCTVLYCTV